uniref:CONSTANS-like protein n=1 Tax=Ipomoea nil TaxID=35883 RepID=Q9FUK8_IPONI|nr:CONSTANS-like protein [Ipomoea nil]
MLKEESCEVLDLDVTIGSSSGSRSGNKQNWARVCDICRSAACSVYCRADLAYLCGGCDARVHGANTVAGRHERVLVCEACESAPATVICKADAASLCAACDSDIHSANPLARRHHRVPILPISGTLYGPPTSNPCRESSMMVGLTGDAAEEDNGFLTQDAEETTMDEDEDEAASWLLLNPNPNPNPNPVKSNNSTNMCKGGNNNNNEMSCAVEAVDAYLDLAEFSSCHNNLFEDKYSINQQQNYSVPQRNMSYRGDSIVPNHGKNQFHYTQGLQQHNHHAIFNCKEWNMRILTRDMVSISSMDVGVVPESTLSDTSISHSRASKGTIDLFSGPPIQMPPQLQLSQMDREARVLRYREKKKTRKFEKTIRYASRKAYAETRPRIKGRFAKRTDVDTEVDQIFYAPLMAESGYGIVPSF